MSSSREGPNPLRPYYIPPSIGLPSETTSGTSSGPRFSNTNKSGNDSSYASSARDIFSEIDYSGYVSDSSQSTLDTIKELLDQALYRYISVLLSQPFEVAKTILQVRSQAEEDGTIPITLAEDTREQPTNYRDTPYADYPSDDSDPDEPAYFTSSAPSSSSYSPSRSRRRHMTENAGHVLPSQPSSSEAPHQLLLRRPDSIFEVISQLWKKEGAWGVWKCSNTTLIYSILLKTTESWSRSLLAAVVNVPDPGMIAGLGLSVDVVDSPYPWASFGVAMAASAIAGILLAPLDIVRTKLMLTPISRPKRGMLHDSRLLPSLFCPPALLAPTFLHSIISPAMTHSTPLVLRSRLGIDPLLTPTTFSVATFLSSTIELFLKLPIETALRRGQMAVLLSPPYLQNGKKLETIVNIGAYRGTAGTMWMIVREEGGSKSPHLAAAVGGIRPAKKTKSVARKGQGIEGLWRGWRVGMWGLVGIWGAAIMGHIGGSGGEF